MAATIYDVAKLAGVGLGTVSRVLNNSPAVNPATRKRVQDAIARLDYSPNPIARGMIGGRTGALAVISPFFTRAFPVEVLKGVEAAASRLDYELVIYNIESEAQRADYFKRLPMRHRVDGLLLVSLAPEDSLLANFQKAKLPAVLVDAYSSCFTSIVVNNLEGAYTAVKFLLQQGHRRIGFINGKIEGDFKFNQANDRLIGVHRALGEAGVLFDPDLMQTADWNRAGGREAAQRLLSLADPPTAIFAASDVQALGALEVARAHRLSVPGDLSIIGFDGIELSELLELSTVQQPMQQMGELGVTKLLELVEMPHKPPELIRLDTSLVIRQTTGNPINKKTDWPLRNSPAAV